METTDTITKQFVEGFGVIEVAPDEFIAEPIRQMTTEEVKERNKMQYENTSSAMRKRVLEQKQLTNGNFLKLTENRRIPKDHPQA